jgi:oligopeptide transport system substrate-binding protein
MCGVGALMLAVFFGPRRRLPVLPRPVGDEKVIRIAYTQNLQPDPHRRLQPLAVQNQFVLALWEPLIECDSATGQPQPAAAESWTWSEDHLVLTVKLRPDGRWSNGDPVTARDFVRGWHRLLRQPIDTASVLFPLRNAELLHLRKRQGDEKLGVEAADDLTLRITLAGIRSTFLAELADPLFSPVHESMEAVLREQGYWAHPEKLVTNGAFQLEQVRADGYRLRSSAHYRDRAKVQLAGVQFIRVGNMGMAQLLASAGMIDVLAPPPGNSPAKLPTTRCLTEESELALVVSTLDLNVTRGPLRDLRVRKALSLALDRAGSIPEMDRETMVPAFAWVPDMPGRPGLTLLREDAGEARRLLAEAGYPGGEGFPVLVLPVAPAWKGYTYLQAWTDRWYRELGIRTYLAYEREPSRRARMASGDYDIFYNGLLATVPDAGDMLATFTMPGVYNATRWANSEVTRLLAGADRKTGPERLAMLEQAERIVMSEVPTIPTMFEQRRTLLAIEVGGWYADPLGRQLLKHLSIRTMPPENSAGRGFL